GYAETHQYGRAIEYAHLMVQSDPLREGTCYNLMRLYMAVGRPQEALNQYQALEQLLHKELQCAPSAPLRELAEKLRQAVPSSRSSLEARTSESRPGESAPSPRPSSVESSSPNVKLPLQFTRFFGRESEIQQLIMLVTGKAEEAES